MWRQRRQQLFDLLLTLKHESVPTATVSQIDQMVENQQSAAFIKHDVHGVCLDSLVEFAAAESQIGVVASYFFMPPDHPLVAGHVSPAGQEQAMLQIQSHGHEVGVHLDSYHYMHSHPGVPYRDIVLQTLDRWRGIGLHIRAANAHGNTRLQFLDRNGNATSMEVYEEVARQLDYPQLALVPPEAAEVIRRNRTSLRVLELDYWADARLWSRQHGHVFMSSFTDNSLGRDGTVRIDLPSDGTHGYWGVERGIDYSTPGSWTVIRVDLATPQLKILVRNDIAHKPCHYLIHPQFYCDISKVRRAS